MRSTKPHRTPTTTSYRRRCTPKPRTDSGDKRPGSTDRETPPKGPVRVGLHLNYLRMENRTDVEIVGSEFK